MDAHSLKLEAASNRSIFAQVDVGSFWLVLAVLATNLVLYTAIPTIFASNLPLDAIEALYWGKEWQLGYFKHPPMSAWMIESVVQLFGRSDWLIFASAQICIILAVLPILLIVHERYGMRASGYTALAVFLTHFSTLTSVEYNVNIGFLPFWSWMVFTFLKAEGTDRIVWWSLFGLVSAGGMYGKYIAGVFLMSAALWTLLKRRDLLLRPGPYLAAAIFGIVVAPHVVWLVNSNFLPIEYAMSRTEDAGTAWYQHILMPINYLVEFLYSVAPMLVALAIAAGWGRIKSISRLKLRSLTKPVWTDPFIFAVIGPIGVIAAISMVLGAPIKTAWSIPLVIVFAGLIGISASVLEKETGSFKQRFLGSWVFLYGALLLVFLGIFAFAPMVKSKPARMQYDGPALTRLVENYWYSHKKAPFEYIVGNRWSGGTVSWYASERPTLFENANLMRSPWVNVEDLQNKGALYVDYNEPTAKIAGMCVTDPQKVLWPMPNDRTYERHPEVWIAVLEPASGSSAVSCEGE